MPRHDGELQLRLDSLGLLYSLFEFRDLAAILSFYRELHQKIRVEAGGVFQRCDGCGFRQEELCSGGCVAHSVGAFMQEERVRFQEVYI